MSLKFKIRHTLWLTCWLVCCPLVAQAQIALSFQPAELQLAIGETALVQVVASEVAVPGLAAFQFTLDFDPSPVDVVNPNEAFRASGILPFAPLGDHAFCTLVRAEANCPDPAWFLTATGRTAVAGMDSIDNARGRVQVVYGTQGSLMPPTGAGAIALVQMVGVQNGSTAVTLSDVVLGSNSSPPESLNFITDRLLVKVGDTFDPPPAAPIGVVVRGKGLRVNVTWSRAEDAANFIVFRRLNGEVEFARVGQTTRHVLADTLPGGTSSAEYYVVAENVFGQSAPSAIVTVMPRASKK